MGAKSGRAACSANRTTEGSADDIDHLIDVGIGFATLGGGSDAAANVILEDQDADRVEGRSQGSGLLEDVHAVLFALDHPSDAADLALDPAQAADEGGLVLGVAVPEVIGGFRAGTRMADRAPRRGPAGSNRACHVPSMIPPRGIGCQTPGVHSAVGRSRLD